MPLSEPAFNSLLGAALRSKYPQWEVLVENTDQLEGNRSACPDFVIALPGGLSVVVENEYEPARKVEAEARSRLGKTLVSSGIIEQVIALRTPKYLSKVPSPENIMHKANFALCIPFGEAQNPLRWPNQSWVEVDLDGLASVIEIMSLSERRIRESMEILTGGVQRAEIELRKAGKNAPDMLDSMAKTLCQKDSEQTSKMAMAIIANALTFHTAIAGSHGIENLDQIRRRSGRNGLAKSHILAAWEHIYTKVNYLPIFKIAADLLLPIVSGAEQKILRELTEVAAKLTEQGATTQYDLNARLLQRLITDRKFLATYYTLPQSARLLAEFAISHLDVDWSDKEAVSSLRIADFACGTGALLSSAYSAAMSKYRRGKQDDQELHPLMLEKVLVGTDIMPVATHLTASVLASAYPHVPFKTTSIATLPYGKQLPERGGHVAIGALDLIEDEKVMPLFESGQERVQGSAEGSVDELDLPHESFDLVIMNPPFTSPTRSVVSRAGVPRPDFAGFQTSQEEQRQMGSRLKEIMSKKSEAAGHGNAGLAAYFIDLAHAKVKKGGVIAFVLPATFASGESWSNARNLIAKNYQKISIFSLMATGSGNQAFSADTGMGEVLLVATKGGGRATRKRATYINLEKRPETILEAAVAAQVIGKAPPNRNSEIYIGEEVIGSCLTGDCQGGKAGVREASVADAGEVMYDKDQLLLPRLPSGIQIPVVELGKLGERGLLGRDITGDKNMAGVYRGPFVHKKGEPPPGAPYPTLWNHCTKNEKQIVVLPDSQCVERTGYKNRALEVWRKSASHLHINCEFRLNSVSLAACITEKPAIGGRAWPSFVCHDRRWDYPLVLWANTTPGLIAFWWLGSRQQQGRSTLSISRHPELKVLDPRKLSPSQLKQAEKIFKKFKGRTLLSANEAYGDEVRKELDRAVLIDLLGLSDEILEPLELLRLQWCSESSVHGGKQTRPNGKRGHPY